MGGSSSTSPDTERPSRRSLAVVAGIAATLLALAALRPAEAGWAWRPLHPVVAVFLAALVVALPRDRGALAVLGVSIVARAWAWQPTVLLHFAKPYGLLVQARGLNQPDVRYGDGHAALHGLFARLVGWTPELPHLVATAFSAVLPALLHDAVRRATDDRGAAFVGGMLAATMPLVVAVASGPEQAVVVATVQVAAIAGGLRADAVGDLLAAMALAMLAHLRPDEVPVALVLVAWLVARGRLWAAGAAALLVLARAIALGSWLSARGDDGAGWPQWWTLPGEGGWAGPGAAVVLLDPLRVPAVVPLLAGVGALAAVRARPAARGFVVLGAVTTLLLVDQLLPSDQLRFQLPSVAWGCALAGTGWTLLRAPAWRAAAVVLAVSTVPLAAAPLSPPFTWRAEHAALVDAARHVPAGATVRYAASHDPHGAFRTWASWITGARWLPVDGPEQPGELRWVGTADLHRIAPPVPWPRLVPFVTTTAPGVWGDVVDWRMDAPYPPDPVPIGLYRVVLPP